MNILLQFEFKFIFMVHFYSNYRMTPKKFLNYNTFHLNLYPHYNFQIFKAYFVSDMNFFHFILKTFTINSNGFYVDGAIS